jgi:predicted DCC family thiol-disulfide oxidoreductase YuxK
MTESLQNSGGPVVLFDGVCNLCNGAVRFLVKIDRKKFLRFSALQGRFAAQLKAHKLPDYQNAESILLYHNGDLYTHSDAVLKICDLLGGGWRMLYLLRFVPGGLRDRLYQLIARNRYRWFGKKDACMIPGPELQDRFLD